MLTIITAIIVMQQQSFDIGPILYEPSGEKHTVGEDGNLYFKTNHFIYGWNTDLEKVLEYEIPLKDHSINSFFVDKNFILLSLFRFNEFSQKTIIINFQGETISELPLFSLQYRKLNNQLYYFKTNYDEKIKVFNGAFPYQYQPIEIIQKEQGRYVFQEQGLPLFKTTPMMNKFNLNFKDSWGVYKNGLYYFVNEIEPMVWIISPSNAIKKYKEGVSQPGNLPSIPLKLERFNPLTEMPQPRNNGTKKDGGEQFGDYLNRHSFIQRFQTYGKGYLVAYTYPQCDEDGRCGEQLLALQKFDDQFQPLGKPHLMPGQLLGTIDSKVYIIQFEDKKPKPSFGELTNARIVVLDQL